MMQSLRPDGAGSLVRYCDIDHRCCANTCAISALSSTSGMRGANRGFAYALVVGDSAFKGGACKANRFSQFNMNLLSVRTLRSLM